MSSYWSQFPDFDHDANAPIKQEFARLAQVKGWIGKAPQKEKKYRREWGRCFDSEFNEHYTRDASSLDGWQSLCKEVGLEDIPQSVTGCKKAIKGKVWVNIVDLVDCRRTESKVKCHKTIGALRRYTMSTERIFPKAAAKKNGFLTALLITL